METQIITNGVNEFTPLIEKLGDIATEFIPYIIYIGIACIGIALMIEAVKYILEYQRTKTTMLFNRKEDRIYDTYEKSDFEKSLEKDGIDTLFGENEVVRTEKKAYKGGGNRERDY